MKNELLGSINRWRRVKTPLGRMVKVYNFDFNVACAADTYVETLDGEHFRARKLQETEQE